MRLLGANLLPFSVAQLPSTWSTGIEVEAYYFEGDMPADISQYFLDNRKLIADCIAASRIVLKPTADGLMFNQPYSHGVKAVAGSVYDPKLGVTIHYPKNIIPRRTTASASAMDIDTAYATDLVTGNKKMKQHPSIGLFPGFPIGSVLQTSDYAGTLTGQIATVADLVFDNLITFDGALSDTPTKDVIAALQIIAASTTSGATASGTTVNLSIPIGAPTYAAPSPIVTDILRVVGNANVRRVLPISVGNKSTAKVTKTIGHAILIFTDSNNNSIPAGTADVRMMATKVGLKGSNNLIELESLSISTGEFPEVLQVRTSRGLDPSSVFPAWISPNATIALTGANLSGGSPAKDYRGNTVTFTQWPVQPDGSLKGESGSVITISSRLINPASTFFIEFEYRQDDISSPAEINFFRFFNSFYDRIEMAFDRSNGSPGLCIWNNDYAPPVTRGFGPYGRMLSTTFVKVLYQYDSATSLHTVHIDGVLVDSWTYTMKAVTLGDPQIFGNYGNQTALPRCYIRNYQAGPGKR